MEGVARSSGTRTCSVPMTKGKVGKFEISVLTATKQTTPNGTTRLSSVSQTSLVSLTIGCKDFQFPKVSWFLRCPLGVPVMAYGQQSCPPGYAAEERHNLTMKPLKKSCGCLGGGGEMWLPPSVQPIFCKECPQTICPSNPLLPVGPILFCRAHVSIHLTSNKCSPSGTTEEDPQGFKNQYFPIRSLHFFTPWKMDLLISPRGPLLGDSSTGSGERKKGRGTGSKGDPGVHSDWAGHHSGAWHGLRGPVLWAQGWTKHIRGCPRVAQHGRSRGSSSQSPSLMLLSPALGTTRKTPRELAPSTAGPVCSQCSKHTEPAT